MSSLSRQQLEAYLQTIDVKARTVVDVGGAQNPIKGRTKSFEVEKYIIADLEKPHQTKVNDWCILDLNGNFKSNFIRSTPPNVVFCIEVMEYVHDPMQAIENMYAWLEPGGVLYISFHFIYPLHPPTGLDYLRYTRYGAVKLLESVGFRIEQYHARRIGNVELYSEFLNEEGYRYDKDLSVELLTESGCIIKAVKN